MVIMVLPELPTVDPMNRVRMACVPSCGGVLPARRSPQRVTTPRAYARPAGRRREIIRASLLRVTATHATCAGISYATPERSTNLNSLRDPLAVRQSPGGPAPQRRVHHSGLSDRLAADPCALRDFYHGDVRVSTT